MRTEKVEGAPRRVFGGEIVLSAAQWNLHGQSKDIRPGDSVTRMSPKFRHVRTLDGGDVLAEVLLPHTFKVGEVLRFPD